MNRSIRSGMTLVEIMAFLLVFGPMLLAVLRFSQAQQVALRTVQENTVGLFALESARNFVLARIENGQPFTRDDAENLSQTFSLPYGLKLHGTLRPGNRGEARLESVPVTVRDCLILSVAIPPRGPRPARRLERTMELP
jgi:type II secretory pathway pseudopilin PulG